MTNSDSKQTVNERVALRRRWKEQSTGYWYLPDTLPPQLHYGAPDFCGKWEHAGPLFIELIEKTKAQIFYIDNKEYGLVWPGRIANHAEGKTLTEAITRAWDAWQEQSNDT